MADFTFAHREEGFDEHINNSIRGYSDLLQDVISYLDISLKMIQQY